MLEIYAVPVSLYSAKTRIMLRHKGLDWEEVLPPGGYGSAEYKTHVPSGNIPALMDGDLLLSDSEAIAEYLEEAFPDPPMLPRDLGDRAKTRERSRFHDTRLEPELRKLFPYFRTTEGRAAALQHQSAALTDRLQQLAEILDGYPPRPADGLTLADCGYPVTFAWLAAVPDYMDLRVDWPAAVLSYRDDLARIPAVATELENITPVIADWLSG